MKTQIVRITCSVLALFVVALALSGCNAWKGLGKDFERAGEKMQGED